MADKRDGKRLMDTCPVCGRVVPVFQTGRLWKHYRPREGKAGRVDCPGGLTQTGGR
jgi:hypothetical protein